MKLKIPKILKISAFYLYNKKGFDPNAMFCASFVAHDSFCKQRHIEHGVS